MIKYKFKKINVTKPDKEIRSPEHEPSLETILACHEIRSEKLSSLEYLKKRCRYSKPDPPYLYPDEVDDILDDMRDEGADFSFDE